MGNSARFRFTNHNSGNGTNWENWVLVAANSQRGSQGYAEYCVLRNDNYAWDSKGNSFESSMTYPFSFSSNFNWDTFVSDMNGSTVDMTVKYTTAGNIEMNSIIKTASGKTYPYSFVYRCAAKASSILLFFTTEKSYITSETTGITNIQATQGNSRTYNLSGQRVNGNYRGIVIRNGKKMIMRSGSFSEK